MNCHVIASLNAASGPVSSGTIRRGARLADMETQTIRPHLKSALKTAEIRRACCAVEAILRAADILDNEPPVVLEEVRDYCTEYVKGRKGAFSEFKHAWINLVVEHLENARQMERSFYKGLTGEDWHPTGD